jgi:hypothetical protein
MEQGMLFCCVLLVQEGQVEQDRLEHKAKKVQLVNRENKVRQAIKVQQVIKV